MFKFWLERTELLIQKQGLEELASVMGGRLNFTLEQASEFNLDSIPDASADDIEFVEGEEFIEDAELVFDENEFEHTAENQSIDHNLTDVSQNGSSST